MKTLMPERKRAEKTLRPSQDELEQRVAELSKENAELAQERRVLRTLIDSLPDYIFVKDRQSRFLVNNLAHARVLGANRPDEVAGKTDLDIFPAELAKQYFADEQALMKSGQLLNREETTVDPKTGETRWLQTTKTPLWDQERKVVGMVGISRDITERKQAEEALRQSRDELEKRVAERTTELSLKNTELARTNQTLSDAYTLLQAMLDNIPDRIYFKDTQSRFLKLSKALAKRLGLADAELAVGKTDFDFHPREQAGEFYQDEQRIIRTGEALINKTERQILPNGEIAWTSTTKVPLRDKDGKIVGVAGINRDITEQKRVEEALAGAYRLLQTMLDNIPDRIYFKDAQSRFLKLSRALAKRLGVADPESVVGKTDFDFHPPERAREFFQDEQKIMQTGQSLINKIERQTTPEGETIWASVTKVPVRDSAGVTTGIIGISRDITDLKRAEKELERTHRRLLDVSRLAGMAEVATGVLHNVGNVLNSVNVSAAVISERLRESKAAGVAKLAKLLREHSADVGRFMMEDERGRQVPTYLEQLSEHLERERGEVREELKNLATNIEHIKEIVTTQQNYAQISGLTETVALPDLVEDALKIHSGAYVRHGVAVVREFEPVPTISVDKHKVLQILVNLFSNAKYACDAGGGNEKQVTVRIKPAGAGRVKIEVADTGVGIAPENLTRIFAQGFTTRKGGHGFGLHSGALAARQLDGSLSVHSGGLGRGSTFTLELPTMPAQDQPENPPGEP